MFDLIKTDQKINYPELHDYFDKPTVKSMPHLVGQLNLFRNLDGFIRVRGKFKKWIASSSKKFPLLLHRESVLTDRIIYETHKKFMHAGIYSLLTHLRKEFYIPRFFTVVKRILASCQSCKRFNSRTIKINQSFYRDFRENPPQIPFRSIFLDHFGPYNVRVDGKKVKVWILCICCLWSRAINLKISYGLTTKEFLRTLQIHIFENGLPETCFSDLGSQIVAGGNLVSDLLKDHKVQEYFDERNMKLLKFSQYSKGRLELGALVESCVKLSRKLIDSSIRNNVLDAKEFELVISQVNHLVKKRPLCFKESLRDGRLNVFTPDPITPEMIMRGHDLPSLNILPSNESNDEMDDWLSIENTSTNIRNEFSKMNKIRERIKTVYHEEFLGNLIHQATNSKRRYDSKSHHKISAGDIVLIKEDNTKAVRYPIALVETTEINDLGETTSCSLKKANGEVVSRHVSSLIPYISDHEKGSKYFGQMNTILDANDSDKMHPPCEPHSSKSQRSAAKRSSEVTRGLFQNHLA